MAELNCFVIKYCDKCFTNSGVWNFGMCDFERYWIGHSISAYFKNCEGFVISILSSDITI